MRLLHGADRRQAGEILRQGAFDRGRQTGADDRGARHAGTTAPAAAGLSRRAGRAMRLLPAGDHHHRGGIARCEPGAKPGRDRPGARRQYLPLRQPCAHSARRSARRRADAGGGWPMSDGPRRLPALLQQNPRLDQWIGFPEAGKARISTGRVEIGQGVLTAMRQIAAEELGVDPARIVLQTGDTALTPNEGYTAGSQSIQFGGIALRLVCAEVRELVLDHAAAAFEYERTGLTVRDGAILYRGTPTGQDYWSLAGNIDLSRNATGGVRVKKAEEYTVVGQNAARVDLAAKVFGEAAFVHDMTFDGMAHARMVRQPRSGARITSIDEDAIRRAAKGQKIEIVRDDNFLAIVGADETVVESVAAVAPANVRWDGVEPLSPFQEEARWLLQQPALDREVGAPDADPSPGATRREATFTRMNLSHASIAPSCGIAVYRDGRLEVWTHSQGGYPLRAALARTLKLDPAAIVVHHAQGPGCYGHNGADDAAADAAVLATLRPGTPVRVRWRREEEV